MVVVKTQPLSLLLLIRTIETKNHNHSINEVNNLGYDRWLIYKQDNLVLSTELTMYINWPP